MLRRLLCTSARHFRQENYRPLSLSATRPLNLQPPGPFLVKVRGNFRGISTRTVLAMAERVPEHSGAQQEYTNRLAREHSPYLLQHAHNPVDWYPWGEEAFAKARSEEKPIFLSIGYSTCHWCHVMEVESFENEEVAKLLNEGFVSIKVDREERPDVDKVCNSYLVLDKISFLYRKIEATIRIIFEISILSRLKALHSSACIKIL